MRRSVGAAGRPGALEEARELVALVGSLSEAGDALTAEAVSSKLGVSPERAEKLISLVMESCAKDGERLPLASDGPGGEVALISSEGIRGRRLRLTGGEALAVSAALERLGVAAGDPLAEKVAACAREAEADLGLVERMVGAISNGGGSRELLACARACAQGRELGFDYRKADGSTQARRVLPQGLWSEAEAWYLDAWDLDRLGNRTFRVDRMEGASVRGGSGRAAPRPAGAERAGRMVTLVFSDPRYLDLLAWHDLEVEEVRPDGSVVGRTPWYGGEWLARMVAACAGTCSTTSEELSRAVRAYAKGQLSYS